MDTQQTNEIAMLEALLTSIQRQSSNSDGQIYEDVDDDDDDEYDEDDEDEDEDGYYEHNIQTLLNPYESEPGIASNEIGGAGMPMQNMQAMNLIQGILNGSNFGDIGAALGDSINGGIGGINTPMENSSANFLPNMQATMPNMNSDLVGAALASAFASGGMGTYVNYGNGGTSQLEEFEDEEVLSDDDCDDDDEDDDDDDDEGDDDDDDDEESPEHRTTQFSGNVMAATGILAGSAIASKFAFSQKTYQTPQSMFSPNQTAQSMFSQNQTAQSMFSQNQTAQSMFSQNQTAQSMFSPNQTGQSMISQNQITQHLPLPSGNRMTYPPTIPLPIGTGPLMNAITPVTATTTTLTSSSLASMSGGKVSRVDPLAVLSGIGGLSIGASILNPLMSTLGNSGGTTVITKMDNPTLVESSLISSSNRTSPLSDNDATLAFPPTKLDSHYNQTRAGQDVRLSIVAAPPQTELHKSGKILQQTKLECDSDKYSLGSTSSAGSVISGCEKSDTESFGKKTPIPGQEITKSNHTQGGSCASITDLASATESMRDSDTDYHFESHNYLGSLSEDSQIFQQQQRKLNELSQFPVGPLPIVIERPSYGWNSMIGLENAKGALKSLFHDRAFPTVFDGTEGSCKGILLFGPPGSGKTTLSRALGKEVNNAVFVGINTTFLVNSHPIEAIKLVRCMFEQARHQGPAVILFDDIDSLCYHPQVYKESAIRATEEILAQSRGMTTMQPFYPPNVDVAVLNEGILVLGTTNKPWLIEERLRKLFTYNIHVRLPNNEERFTLFKAFLETLPNRINESELSCIVSKSDGYSASEINIIIRQTSHKLRLANPNTLDTPAVTYDDIASELTQYRPNYNEELEEKFSVYIKLYTHRNEEVEDNSKEKKDKPKGVKKFSQRIAKSLAAAVFAVID